MPRRSLLGFQRGCRKHFHDSHAFIYGLNMGIDAIYSMLSFALGKAAGGWLLSIGRQGFFFIPVILLLPYFIGINGVILAQPIADLLTLICMLILGGKLNREIAMCKGQALHQGPAEAERGWAGKKKRRMDENPCAPCPSYGPPARPRFSAVSGSPFFRLPYPRATSRIIMQTKPAAKPMVPMSECSPAADSGISSSTTT